MTNQKTQDASSASRLSVKLGDDPLSMQDMAVMRMWKAAQNGKGVNLSSDEVYILMGNAFGNWSPLDQSPNVKLRGCPIKEG